MIHTRIGMSNIMVLLNDYCDVAGKLMIVQMRNNMLNPMSDNTMGIITDFFNNNNINVQVEPSKIIINSKKVVFNDLITCLNGLIGLFHDNAIMIMNMSVHYYLNDDNSDGYEITLTNGGLVY